MAEGVRRKSARIANCSASLLSDKDLPASPDAVPDEVSSVQGSDVDSVCSANTSVLSDGTGRKRNRKRSPVAEGAKRKSARIANRSASLLSDKDLPVPFDKKTVSPDGVPVSVNVPALHDVSNDNQIVNICATGASAATAVQDASNEVVSTPLVMPSFVEQPPGAGGVTSVSQLNIACPTRFSNPASNSSDWVAEICQLNSLTRVEVPADGDCLFHAVSHCLAAELGQHYSVQQLRDMVADRMDDNPEEYQTFYLAPDAAEKKHGREPATTFDAFRQAIRHREWGTELVVAVLTDCLPVAFCSWSTGARKPWVIPHGLDRPILHLVHYAAEAHYVALVRPPIAPVASPIASPANSVVNDDAVSIVDLPDVDLDETAVVADPPTAVVTDKGITRVVPANNSIAKLLKSSIDYDGNDTNFNMAIHDKIKSELNFVGKSCTVCSSGFLNVKFDGDRCQHCRNYKVNGRKFRSNLAPENEMDPGVVPAELLGLSLFECRLIAMVNASLVIVKLRYGMLANSGHTIFFHNDVNKIVQQLPKADANIVVIGRTRGDGKVSLMRVRRDRIKAALVWLQANNPHYANVVIDQDALDAIPVDGFGEPTRFVSDANIPAGADAINDESCNRNTDAAVVCDLLKISDEGVKDVTLTKLKMLDFVHPLLEPVNEFRTPGLLSKAFPHLLPFGNCDMFREPGSLRKNGKVTNLEFAKYLFSHSDSRFRKDLTFKFVLCNMLYRYELLESAKIALSNPGLIKDLSIDAIRTELKNENSNVKKRLSVFKAKITGSQQYWNFERSKVEHTCKQTGFPCLFVTLSCADHHWKELRDVYHAADDDILKDLVNQDPFPSVVYFSQKVSTFMEDFFPQFYHVIGYHGRYEFQSRGSIHYHGLVWIKEYAEICQNDRLCVRKIAAFVDNVVSAINPYFKCEVVPVVASGDQGLPGISVPAASDSCSSQADAPLKAAQLCSLGPSDIPDVMKHADQLINAVLRHDRCGVHCLKTVKGKQICRFKFPKEVREFTVVEPGDDGSLEIKLKRNDPLVSSTIRRCIGMFNSNCVVDVVDSMSKLFRYLLKYITKYEKKSDKLERVTQLLNDESIDDKGCLIRKYYMLDGRKEVSAHEAVMYLLRINLVVSSFSFTMLNTSHSRLLGPKGFESSDMNKYATRDPKYHNLSMFQYFKQNYVFKNGTVRERPSDKVIVVPIPYLKALTEEYYKRECVLHIPWHAKEELELGDGFTLWQQKFNSVAYPYVLSPEFDKLDVEKVDINDLVTFVNETNPLDPSKEIDDYLDIVQTDTITYDELLKSEGDFLEFPDYDWNASGNNPLFSAEILKSTLERITSATKVENFQFPDFDVTTLNNQQMQIYRHVERHFNSKDRRQLFLAVSGAPGTGKSYVIRALQSLLKNKQMTAAHSGAAACLLLNGMTIHSMLGMGINQANTALASDTQERLRQNLKNVEYIVLDEFSLIGLNLFGQIENRLRQIFSDRADKSFAGFNVILFGDIYQLGPVLAQPIYAKALTRNPGHSVNGELAYSLFVERAMLTQSMRHASDSLFHELLDRVKIGASTEQDYRKLQSIFYNHAVDFEFCDTAVRIIHENDKCMRYNKDQLQCLQLDTNPVALMLEY